jgi:diguanylate cyclase (GGDEF)-like protein
MRHVGKMLGEHLPERPPMPAAPLPHTEHSRLAMLEALGILDTPPEHDYDDIVAIAAGMCGAPRALISLVDADRQWFKARMGVDDREMPRDVAFCAHAILRPDEPLVVPDASRDPRFADNPLVTDGDLRFYAGMPLLAGGQAVGTVCVLDTRPRALEPGQEEALRALSRQASRLLELRRLATLLDIERREREWVAAELARDDRTGEPLLDPLTGLPGTRALLAMLDEALMEGAGCDREVQLALVEMDGRDTLEQLYGAVERDRALRSVASLLRSGDGLLGRLSRSGDAFAAVLAMPSSQARAQCELVRTLAAGDAAALPVSLSIGLASAAAGQDARDWFSRASAALARARETGGDRVVVAD